MNLALWVAAWLLSVIALAGGIIKTIIPSLILPAVLDIATLLVPVTASCWILLMIGAIIIHLRFREFKLVLLTLFYLALAAFIAWWRFGLNPSPAE